MVVVLVVDSGRGVGLLAQVAPQLIPRGEQLLAKPAITYATNAFKSIP